MSTVDLPTTLVNKYNVNDNVPKVLNNNVNDIDNKADMLVARLNNPASREFYCKVAMRLSEAQIIRNLETALRGNNPQRYFTWLCNRDMI